SPRFLAALTVSSRAPRPGPSRASRAAGAGGDSRWSGVEGGDEDDAVGVAVDAGTELARLVLDGAGVAFVVAGDGVDEQVTSGGQLVLGEGQTAGLGAHWDLLSGGGGEDVEQFPHLVRCEVVVCGDVAPHEITGTADEGGEEAGRAGGERNEGRGLVGAELGALVGVVLVERGNDGVDGAAGVDDLRVVAHDPPAADVLHEGVGGLAARLGGQASLGAAGGGHGVVSWFLMRVRR